MKLLLHWLAWDLRRFRWPLLAWTALLAAFMAWLGYANSHLLTMNTALLSYNGGMAAVLGIAEVFILLTILSSDPAAGASPFWKTRPPSGFAVAGARLVIALLFFIALPLLGWWSVLKSSDSSLPPFLNVRLFITPNTWMEYLWWMQSLIVSVLVLTTAAARGAGNAVVRVLAAIGVIFLLFFAAAFIARGRESFAGEWVGHAVWNAWSGSATMTAAGLWLVITAFVYLAARHTRTPARTWHRAHLVLPLAMLAGGAWLAQPHPKARNAPEPALRSELAPALRVGEPLLRGGVSGGSQEVGNADGTLRNAPSFSLQLHFSGLPANHVALARWKKLTLTAPDGRTRTLQTAGGLEWRFANLERPDILTVVPALLHKPEDAAFSLTPCRAEGILSIEVRRKHRATMPVRAGARMQTTHADLLLTEVSPSFSAAGQPWFEFRTVLEDFRTSLNPWLENRAEPHRRMELQHNGGGSGVGWFILHAWSRWSVIPSSHSPLLAQARFVRDAEAGKLDDWQFGMSWYESEGWIEVPVTLEQVVMPQLPGDERKAQDICDQLRIAPDATADDIRRTIKYALALSEMNQWSGDPKDDPLLPSVARLLESVPLQHREVLLRIAEEDAPDYPNHIHAFDVPLRKRIAALLTAEDIPALRQKPHLFQCLRFELADRKLIPYEEAHGADWQDMDDAALLRNWEQSYQGRIIYTDALDQAARRGLPWVLPAIAEIADLTPDTHEAREVARFMSAISGCPADAKAGVPWLRQNATRLTWNAAAKRWVLPKP